LPSHGTIHYDALTRYWYIKLPPEWQRTQKKIVSVVHNSYRESPWYTESEQLCIVWNEMINTVLATADQSMSRPPVIRCVSPPSVVGLHISLTSKDISDPDLPRCLVVGRRVQFEISGLTSLRSQRPYPQNIAGQHTNADGLRFYPTRWIFVKVNFVDFEFEPRYPPHISVGCVAVQLDVNRVEEFTVRIAERTESGSNCSNSEKGPKPTEIGIVTPNTKPQKCTNLTLFSQCLLTLPLLFIVIFLFK